MTINGHFLLSLSFLPVHVIHLTLHVALHLFKRLQKTLNKYTAGVRFDRGSKNFRMVGTSSIAEFARQCKKIQRHLKIMTREI